MSTTGPVVETVSRKRVVPLAELETEKKARTTPDFWEFLESMTDDMWAGDYMLYIMREDPKPSNYGGSNTLEKCPGYMVMPNGVRMKLDSREDVELAIKEKWGGKAFRLILKKGRERLTEGKCMNDAPPKYPDTAQQQYTHPIPGAATDASVASKAIDAMAAQQPDAMRLAMDVLSRASELVMRNANPPVPAATTSTLIDQTVIQSLITKALNPPPPPPAPDPIALFIRFKELMGAPASNGVKDTLDLITTLKSSGLVGGGATGKTSLVDLGMAIIPQVVTGAQQAIHEWRLGVEAQVRGVELSRGMNPTPLQPGPAPAPAEISAPAVQPNPQPQAAPSADPPFDWLAGKVVEILREPSYTIDEAVDETLSFFYRAHPPVVALLLDPPKLNAQLPAGEQGLLMLFQHHPLLKQIPVNPRLVEFIKKFIEAAKQAELDRTAPAAAAPNPSVPPSA